ncbi:MAG: gamma-glutamyl-gamma-aminobutyrate hydrolase family protein [Armatimonadetes bacterium]|nr:gamma-glutamyl-gamma-aminobutyrate hydrolase family protein [Armatimonadota bacterium]
MLIGISRDKKLADFLPYKKALENVGAQVKFLYYEDSVIKSDFNKIQGLLIPGGIDIDPFIYGSKRNFLTKKINLKRDLFERDLILKAWERNLPVLGICRGIQILNCVFGGDLLISSANKKFANIGPLTTKNPFCGL